MRKTRVKVSVEQNLNRAFSPLRVRENVLGCVSEERCPPALLPAPLPLLANLVPCIYTPDYHRHGFFSNRKIYRLIITVNKRKSTSVRTRAPIPASIYAVRCGTELLISYRSIMALICMVGPRALSMQMSLQGEKDNLKNKLLLKLLITAVLTYMLSYTCPAADGTVY